MSNSKHAKQLAELLINKLKGSGQQVGTFKTTEFDKLAERFQFFNLTDKFYLRKAEVELVEAAFLRAGYIIVAGNKMVLIAPDSDFANIAGDE